MKIDCPYIKTYKIKTCCEGWYGDYCNQTICKVQCQNNSICVSPGICQCIPPWKGESCQSSEDSKLKIIIKYE